MADGTRPAGAAALGRALTAIDYFALAFGSMIGVGWIVVLDDWLARGGPGGAALAFLLGGLLVVPVGWVYGQLTAAFPRAASEMAYTQGVLPAGARFLVGWLMTLAYLIVCPYEAIAVGELAARLVPALDRVPLYQVGGSTVTLPRLLLGLGLVAAITAVNYHSVRHAANLQNVLTLGLLLVFLLFSALGLVRGRADHLDPPFARPGAGGALLSVLLVLQVVPYFLSGFEAVARCAQERAEGFAPAQFTPVTLLAIAVAVLFYVLVILIVAALVPWEELAHTRSPTLVAFDRAFGWPWLVNVILLGAFFSLIKVYNGCFLAATRTLYGLASEGLAPAGLGRVHPAFRTPAPAVLLLGLFSAAGCFFGKAALVPISDVGSLCCVVGWSAACLALACGAAGRSRGRRLAGALGVAITAALVAMKLVPLVPGSFGAVEWACLAGWLALGGLFWLGRRRSPGEAVTSSPSGSL